nr:tetratricopeptide repeat-containing sulfotransferase family protein [Sphingorhabdus sp. M41]
MKRGDIPAAAAAAKAMISADEDEPAGYFLLGIAAAEAGQIGKAIPLVEAAVERGPEAEHLAQLAKLLILLRRDGEAAAAARKAMAMKPGDARTCDTIGCVFTRLGDHEGSVEPFRSAVAADPDNLDYRYNLAAASSFTGRIQDALTHYEAILAADPGNARAHYALAIASRQTADVNHISRLKTALSESQKPGDGLRIRYALAKELEDIGDPEAFTYLAAANDEHKRSLRYDFAQDDAIFDAIETLFTEPRCKALPGAGNPEKAPIFIVGMPRTGTTLVDRILSSHPDVESAGEMQAMPLAVKRLAATSSRTVIDPATVMASCDIDPAKIGDLYLAQAGHHRHEGTARFTDKLPANFLYIGHIARALPHAKIVCLRRNPMDTVWSNYKNLFASQSAYYAYSYDLLDTARYYERFDRLMAMWDRLFPGLVLQLSYEALVADQEGQTRLLLEHCDLEWNESCLTFHENSAAVATPSAAQVRRPINADGVGKWRTHEAALQPARIFFEQHSIPID